ncbi:MAG: ankyrin repeat domain-containing protein [Cytophagales bacterium]|nr:ankyrin repeat domain-containing protein [Cytophagales bacterium]
MKKIGIQILLLVATLSCSKRKHIELREAQSIQTEVEQSLTRAIGMKLYNAELEESKKIIEYLREEGADFNETGEEGNTLMSFAIQEASRKRLGIDNCIILLGRPSDVNLAEKKRISVPGVVSLLLAAGADVNAKNSKGDTPLHEAAKGGLVEVMRVLIGAGADVNAENKRGNTPLHTLARNAGLESHTKAIKVLIDAGADVNAENYGGDTPLQRAGALFVDMHDYITQWIPFWPNYGEKMGRLFKRTIDSLLEVIRILVEHGAVPDVKFYSDTFRSEPYALITNVGMLNNYIRMQSEDAVLLLKVAYESIKALLEAIETQESDESIKAFLKNIETQESAKALHLVWALGKWRGLDEGTELPQDIKRLIFSNYYKARRLPLRAIEQFLDALNNYVDRNQESIDDLAFITAMREKGKKCKEKIRKIEQRLEPVP